MVASTAFIKGTGREQHSCTRSEIIAHERHEMHERIKPDDKLIIIRLNPIISHYLVHSTWWVRSLTLSRAATASRVIISDKCPDILARRGVRACVNALADENIELVWK
jgi:hypothetical protein